MCNAISGLDKGKKKSPLKLKGDFIKSGDDLLSHLMAVSSALKGLTSLFGMGRGGHLRNSHHKSFDVQKTHQYFRHIRERKYKEQVVKSKLFRIKFTGN